MAEKKKTGTPPGSTGKKNNRSSGTGKGSGTSKNSGSSKTSRSTGTSRNGTDKRKANAAKGRSSSGKNGSSVKRATGIPSRTSQRLKDEIWAIVLIAFGIFIAISIQTETTGEFGHAIELSLKGTMGAIAYILPYYLIVYGLLLFSKKMAHISGRSIFFLLFIFINVIILNSSRFLVTGDHTFSLSFIKESFVLGNSLDSGGVIGMVLGYALQKIIGITGVYLFCCVSILISCLLLINTPISQFMDYRKERRLEKLKLRQEEEDGEDEFTDEDAMDEGEDLRGEGFFLAGGRTGSQSSREKGLEKSKWRSFLAKFTGAKAEADLGYNAAEAPMSDVDKIPALATDNNIENMRIKEMERILRTDELGGFTALDDSQRDNSNKKKILNYMKDDSIFDKENPNGEDFSVDEAPVPTGTLGLGDYDVDGILSKKTEEELSFSHNAFSYDSTGDAIEEKVPPIGPEDKVISDFTDLPGFEEYVDMETGEILPGKDPKLSEKAPKLPGKEPEKIFPPKEPAREYKLPPLLLLKALPKKNNINEKHQMMEKAQKLEQVLTDFGVNAKVIDVKKGPAVTRYEIQPATGVKVSSIVRLTDDIALNLEAKSLRVEAPIPGKAAVGIEVENESINMVTLREMLESKDFQQAKSKISFVVGKDISGNSIIGDLKQMPHLLIAGSTGSGKSVCINSLILSILYRATPDEVKLVLIDPKVVELGNYNGIPHMLIPVVTEPPKAAAALGWAVQEMDERYNKFMKEGVRDLKGFNEKVKDSHPEWVMPQIVIIIDELADLMMAASAQVEEYICRLAQKARAAGMHLVVATQRPSVDIITGLIKANIPSRIAFAVSSVFDSRTILDMGGAEKLVGKGDMLYNPIGVAKPIRLQGPFVSDEEINSVIQFWKGQGGNTQYASDVMDHINTTKMGHDAGGEDTDELLPEAIELVVQSEQASASMLQRRFRVGYNRAARLVDMMEARGIIGPSEGSKPRKVLITKEELAELNGDTINQDVPEEI